jgi:DNA-directed RNA polymerase subunit RPC12/RpoP
MRGPERLDGTKGPVPRCGAKIREDHMDQITRCQRCGKRLVPVVTISGRTDLQCISCEDPAVKWAESPRIAPEKPIAAEARVGRVRLLPP